MYVHRNTGYSRSAVVVGAFLASGRVATVEDAVTLLRKARPLIVIRPEAQAALQPFAEGLSQTAGCLSNSAGTPT